MMLLGCCLRESLEEKHATATVSIQCLSEEIDRFTDEYNDGLAVLRKESVYRGMFRDDGIVVRLPVARAKGLGVGLDISSGAYLRLNNIDTGSPVFWHNHKASAEQQLHLGDFIVGINDESGDAETMQATIHMNHEVDVYVRRPYTFEVSGLLRNDKPLGLELSCRRHNTSLVVKEVLRHGAVADWNAAAPECRQIRVDDHILSVNGVARCPTEMRDLINDRDPLDLVVSRPAF